MHLSDRQKWLIVASAASALAAPIAERVLSTAWREAMDDDPPLDVTGTDVPWSQVLAWTAASAVVVGIAQVVARRSAALAWYRVTGTRPPRMRRRKSRR